MSKNYLNARKKLLKACNGYIQHNQGELDNLKHKSFHYPAYSFFDTVLNKDEPAPGFNDWVSCQYYCLLESILHSFEEMISPYQYYIYFEDDVDEIKWWKNKEFDQNEHEIVLHNLHVISTLLDFNIKRHLPRLLRNKKNPHLYSYLFGEEPVELNELPLSVKIYHKLELIKLRADFAESILVNDRRLPEAKDLVRF
ncbi:MAG: hypothetical protein Q8M40_00220 [Legionella sp.]|nr:hypothetical protein [Legionella sp.]